jgi:hypothetical protein
VDFTAHSIYGGPAPSQPDPYAAASGVPATTPGGEPGARTVARPKPGLTGNPTMALVVLLALAALLVNFSVRLEVSG